MGSAAKVHRKSGWPPDDSLEKKRWYGIRVGEPGSPLRLGQSAEVTLNKNVPATIDSTASLHVPSQAPLPPPWLPGAVLLYDAKIRK